LSFVCFFSYLAEINQITFDFAEGESELVSGFNVEFGGGELALNFLVVYAIILCKRLLFCTILGGQ
jgi:NADH-ubiquinone oxidoreductase chain 1